MKPSGANTFAARLCAWFEQHARDLPWRREPTPYRVWVSEIMLQQTQVATVVPYFERFIARFPDVQTLATASEQDVLAQWSGLGYYRRARMLHASAREIVANHGGEIPGERKALLALPGIGRYTAGAILSIAFNKPEPIVDGNVARVFARITREKHTIKGKEAQAAAWRWADSLVGTSHQPRVFNQALMELGATVCTPQNPRCIACPVSGGCEARQHGEQTKLPRAAKRAPLKIRRYIAWLAHDKRGRVLLVKRGPGEESLLPDGLWELPHKEVTGDTPRTAHPVVRQTIMNWRVELEVHTGKPPERSRCESRWFSEFDLPSLPMASITRKALIRSAGA
ncbi:Adenine DNA glycosylase [Planctomycetaceae bacterium]|nr:Adenine DNA glycosylase [Planctomycetaceae bacterium]